MSSTRVSGGVVLAICGEVVLLGVGEIDGATNWSPGLRSAAVGDEERVRRPASMEDAELGRDGWPPKVPGGLDGDFFTGGVDDPLLAATPVLPASCLNAGDRSPAFSICDGDFRWMVFPVVAGVGVMLRALT